MDLFPLQGDPHPALRRRLFLVLPFSQFGLTFFRLEKQAARHGVITTATGLAQTMR
jgi:hypothetical protein